jgi:hypothetical protein
MRERHEAGQQQNAAGGCGRTNSLMRGHASRITRISGRKHAADGNTEGDCSVLTLPPPSPTVDGERQPGGRRRHPEASVTDWLAAGVEPTLWCAPPPGEVSATLRPAVGWELRDPRRQHRSGGGTISRDTSDGRARLRDCPRARRPDTAQRWWARGSPSPTCTGRPLSGWTYGVDLASRDSATVGGTIATNAGGFTCALRTTRAQSGLQCVLADARCSTTSAACKDNTGYSWRDLVAIRGHPWVAPPDWCFGARRTSVVVRAP